MDLHQARYPRRRWQEGFGTRRRLGGILFLRNETDGCRDQQNQQLRAARGVITGRGPLWRNHMAVCVCWRLDRLPLSATIRRCLNESRSHLTRNAPVDAGRQHVTETGGRANHGTAAAPRGQPPGFLGVMETPIANTFLHAMLHKNNAKR